MKTRKDNTSGHRGLSWHKKNQVWMVRIFVENKNIYLGTFKDKEEAIKIYNNAIKEYNKEDFSKPYQCLPRNIQARQWRNSRLDICHEQERRRSALIREIIIKEYGNKCCCCSIDFPFYLTIDHIYNDAIPNKGGCNLYYQIKREGFPKDRYRLMCFSCNCSRRAGLCPHKKRKKIDELRLEMINGYGGKCQICQESLPEFMTIDHVFGINNDIYKNYNGRSGKNLWRELKKMNYPKDIFLLLCYNCNCAKRFFNDDIEKMKEAIKKHEEQNAACAAEEELNAK